MDYPKKLRTLSLCTGYGGIERGIEYTGIECRVVTHVEIEAYAIANLVKEMEENRLDPCPIWSDVKTFPGPRFSGLVDLLTGGFPCQPFSAAGHKKADDDPRHLFPHIKRIISDTRPEYVFLENVDGIASAKLKGGDWEDPEGTPVLLHVCRELERMDYTVEAGQYTAEEMGAPHQRKRWFILGHSNSTRRQSKPRGPFSNEKENGWESESDHEPTGSSKSGSTVLGDSTSEGSQGGDRAPEPKGSPTGCEKVDDPKSKYDRLPIREAEEVPEFRNTGALWPLPPGHLQWDWEAPRTVAYDYDKRESQQKRPIRKERGRSGNSGKGEIEPGLGRATNGTPHRIDRLRLLGNGVVPPTAGRAWIDLWTKLYIRESGDLYT